MLYIQNLGIDPPVVTGTYIDYEDGTGDKCRNDVDPNAQGRVQVSTTIFLNTGQLKVISAVLTDDNDHDGFADTNETVDMKLNVRNGNAAPVGGVTAQVSTNDPKIDCIIDPFINIGTIPAHSQVLTTEAFRFKVANVNRTSVAQSFSVTFNVTMQSDTFDALTNPESVTIDLDLNATGGGGPGSFAEHFDTSLGAFVNENLDQNHQTLALSNGYRCQYSDPDWINSNSYGDANGVDCFLAASTTQADSVFWNIDNTASPGGGRAFAGTGSLHYGINLGVSLGFTTPLAVLEAVKTSQPINLSGSANSELVFRHETSLIDDRTVNTAPGRSADRIVVMGQLADSGGNPQGSWIKLEPYLNGYDGQAEDNYTNCTFDPIDDGSTEDDYFDPTDPDRRLGPSSTCYPGLSFDFQGNTDTAFGVNNIGRAPEGPGLAGALGTGTWIESRVDLSRFRGQRLRLRFLATALKSHTTTDYQAAFGHNPDPGDDGMWLDEVEVSNTLVTPTTLSVDPSPFVGTPCGSLCNVVTASLVVTPSSSPAPGQVVQLDASGSAADRCLNGTVQYRFCISSDGDCDDPGDTILRSWSDNPMMVDAPLTTTSYVAEARCSSLPTCRGSASQAVSVFYPRPLSYFWVVSAGSGSLTIVDPATEQIVDQIALPGSEEPEDIAFSTVDGHAGAFGFVTQGTNLHVVDTQARTLVNTVNVRTLPGFPAVTSVSLRGADSARLQRFTVSGTPTIKAYLHLAANVEVSPGVFQPWFVVIDQERLLGLQPGQVLVQAGALFPTGEPLDVSVISAQEGPEFQRAWYTIRDGSIIRAVRIRSLQEVQTANWQVAAVVNRTAGAGIPDGLSVGVAPPARTPAILPEGPLGTLRDLYRGTTVCTFGGNQRGALVTGPGPISYHLFALDGTGVLRDADPDAPSCGSPQSIPTGSMPVDLDSAGEVFFQRVYVANHGSNDITVLRQDGTTGTITLPVPFVTTGPKAGKFQDNPATSCNIENVQVSSTQISWTPVGCTTTEDFIVWCQCTGTGPCPAECDGCKTGNPYNGTIPWEDKCPLVRTIGDGPWEPLGIAPRSSTSYPVSTPGSVNYVVTFNDTQPRLQ